MPGINGFEATETIRKIEGDTWQTKIIALSADARTENIQIGMLSGLDGYITKPVDPEELIKKIEGIIWKLARHTSWRRFPVPLYQAGNCKVSWH
jgi:CheY-like chemotaxis protein